jgi:hypothetical protein
MLPSTSRTDDGLVKTAQRGAAGHLGNGRLPALTASCGRHMLSGISEGILMARCIAATATAVIALAACSYQEAGNRLRDL